ncbi:MAG: hypothetical protein FJ086_01400 [Deltaproteobacteria bacterium]|nr:hypothetical protein [Deltaproteobacteria bacterium]
MAPIDWKSLQERLEAEAARLSGELKREADRLAAQVQDPAVQARLREEVRHAGQQALEALGQLAAAAQGALEQAQEALRAQQQSAATPPDPTPAAATGSTDPLDPAEPPRRRARKTVGPRKNTTSTSNM